MFFIKDLRTPGFDATNDIFAENARYFRNALVIANYNDLKNGVHETTEYLELFLRNLLLDEKNELYNCSMHISGMFEEADIEVIRRIRGLVKGVSIKVKCNDSLFYRKGRCKSLLFFVPYFVNNDKNKSDFR